MTSAYEYDCTNTLGSESCSISREWCGDSVIQVDDNEECDDGNDISGDGCSSTCVLEEAAECGTSSGTSFRSTYRYVDPNRIFTNARYDAVVYDDGNGICIRGNDVDEAFDDTTNVMSYACRNTF